MEVILLGIYSFFVWLIFFKFKWLPWNTTSQVTVAIIPIVGLTVLILTLNVVAPSSADVRVLKYTIPIVSQVRGRVVEVAVEEGNRLVKKGDVLFRIDPTPYELDVKNLEAQLVGMKGTQRELVEQADAARAKIKESASRGQEIAARLELTRKRITQYRELLAAGAGNKFDLEQAQAEALEQQGQLDAARSAEAGAEANLRQIQQRQSATVKGEFSQVAQVRAQLENAQWLLEQTTTRSPCDCYVVNLQLRPGGFVGQVALSQVMTLIEAGGQVVAFYHQNELHQVAAGDEAEFTLDTLPGKVIKAKVDSIVWAQGAGQLQASGVVPQTGVVAPPGGRYAVKFNIADRDSEVFMAAGAVGHAAIYTDHLHAIHIIRKVIIRVGSYINYLVLKLH
ncbi:MAG TPA: biotin/lipoyl-binding protein [Burkholderiales bacterium]|jgi:multidrug resistance efflux pump|nr:biotin/lipoyl-binding protein [Burkholderiales bacterium]